MSWLPRSHSRVVVFFVGPVLRLITRGEKHASVGKAGSYFKKQTNIFCAFFFFVDGYFGLSFPFLRSKCMIKGLISDSKFCAGQHNNNNNIIIDYLWRSIS